MVEKIEPYIETYTGKRFYFLDPTPEMICIEDIAHALSNNCRFAGHCKKFYSVAEHSVSVSWLTGTLEGLLHDASEAYMVDIPRPIKPYLNNYQSLEKRVEELIFKSFNLPFPMAPITEVADILQLSVEARYLSPTKGKDWDWGGYRPEGGIKPRCLSPNRAKKLFMDRFEELTK